MRREEKSPSVAEEGGRITVESVLEQIGGYSWFQLMATLLIISPEIPAAMNALSPVLTTSATNLQYQCQTENSTHILSKNDMCTFQNCLGPISSGTLPFTSVIQEWDLYCSRSWIVETLTSIQMAGCMVGAIVAAGLADRFGRKPAFFSLCLIMGTFGCMAGLANHLIIFAISRTLAGFAVGGMYVVYINYLMEFLTPNYRTICGCVSFWAFGEILLSLFGFLFPGWRQLTLATSIPALIILLAYPILPESPRWLLCQGRTEEVVDVFNKIASWNGKPKPDPAIIRILQESTLFAHKYPQSTCTTEKAEKECSEDFPKESAFQIFKVPLLRMQILIFMWAWFAISLLYYGLSFNTKNLSGDPNLNVLYLGLTDIPASLSGLLFNNRFGRRRTFMGFSIFSAVLLTTVTILSHTDLLEKYPWLTFFVFLGRCSTAASWAILTCFSAEAFPTSSRASCIGVCSFAGSIGGILAPQLIFLATVWSIGPSLIFSIVSILTCVASLALTETTGKPLKDTIV